MMTLGISREYLIENYSAALNDRRASLFVGAGISRAADLVDWRNLLRGIARELKLNVDEEHDLIAIAQYHVNTKGRPNINRLILKEFLKGTAITDNHRLIATLPLSEVWTTNYDSLLEDAFEQAHKLTDVKRRANDLSNPIPNANVIIYKMHGDVKDPDDTVITKDDFEQYNDPQKRQSFTIALQGHLISKSFLFLGISFTDPNIEYILSRVRSLVGTKAGSEHYCIMKKPSRPSPYKGKAKEAHIRDTARLEHSINDLVRFNINTYLVDDYDEITSVLQELNRQLHLKDIFVSGSAEDYSPLGRKRIDELCYTLGSKIIDKGFNLVSGFGLGIGSSIVSGAVEAVYRNKQAQLSERATLLPFPLNITDPQKRAETFTKYRTDMISRSGFALFICGNRGIDHQGNSIIGTGVMEEFDIAKIKKIYPIPVGATGHAAAEIWKEVAHSPNQFFGDVNVSKELTALNDQNKSNSDYLDAIFSIIKKVSK